MAEDSGLGRVGSGDHGEAVLAVVELSPPRPSAFDSDWIIGLRENDDILVWDGPTTQAFERAEWQFEGSLSRAAEKLVTEPVRHLD